jgi:hypothetical protein
MKKQKKTKALGRGPTVQAPASIEKRLESGKEKKRNTS